MVWRVLVSLLTNFMTLYLPPVVVRLPWFPGGEPTGLYEPKTYENETDKEEPAQGWRR